MKTSFLSHQTALEHMGVRWLDAVVRGSRWDDGLQHVTVMSMADRWSRRGVKCHVCTIDLPAGSLVEVEGVMCVAPEIAFVQMASRLDIQRTILLGLCMCAKAEGYGRWSLTSVDRLRQVAEKAVWLRGRRRALRACQYIQDRCASLLEAQVYMLLCLPNMLGGAGLGRAEFNGRIPLTHRERQRAERRYLEADLLFHEQKVIVEYDSAMFHSGEDARAWDQRRAAVLWSKGYCVIHVTPDVLYNLDGFYGLLCRLESELKRRVKVVTPKFRRAFEGLRRLLPRKVQDEDPIDYPYSYRWQELQRFYQNMEVRHLCGC